MSTAAPGPVTAAFLASRLSFLSIAGVIERAMDAYDGGNVSTLSDVRKVDRWAREFAQDLVREYN